MAHPRLPPHLQRRHAEPQPAAEPELAQPFGNTVSQPQQPAAQPANFGAPAGPMAPTSQPMGATQPQPATSYGHSPAGVRVPDPPRNRERFDEYTGIFIADGTPPPDPYAIFTAQENRVSSPRYLRMTSTTIGIDSAVQNNSGIPLACVFQPLALEEAGEEPVPLVESHPSGPLRCKNCMGYVNPFWQFIDGGRRCICNLCGQVQEVGDAGSIYVGDRVQRPELNVGTYEFVAPADYSAKPICDPTYLICLESSVSSQATGLYAQVLNSLKMILDYVPNPERAKIGILTFDQSVQFYKLSPANGGISEVVLNNMEDPFAPEPINGITFSLEECRDSLDQLIDLLQERQTTQKQVLSIYSLVATLKQVFIGGRLIIFSTLLGTVGAGKLKMRDDPKLYNTDKERSLYTMQDESYFNLAREATNAGMAVDIFACTHQYFDISSTGAICAVTGGQVYYHPRFSSAVDGERLHYQFMRIMTNRMGMQAVMRARVSTGLAVNDYFGNYTRRSPTDIEAGGVDCDKTFTVVLKHEEKLKEENPMYLQFAMLYVDQNGRRLIRVFNTYAPVTQSVMNVFRTADVNTVANVLAKRALSQITQQPLRTIREQWHGSLVSMLYHYRLGSGSQQANQFVLPETLKILPLLSNAAMKLPALSLSKIGVDLRMYSVFTVKSCPVVSTSLMFNPRVYSLHNILTQEHQPGTLSESETTLLPDIVPACLDKLGQDGVYLIDNGEILVFVFAPQADPTFVENLLGCDLNTFAQAPTYDYIQNSQSEEATRVNAVVDALRAKNPGPYQSIKFCFETTEALVKVLMVEDSTPSEMAYAEYIGNLHKVVLNKLDMR